MSDVARRLSSAPFVLLLLGILVTPAAVAQPNLIGLSAEGAPGSDVLVAFDWTSGADGAAVQFDLTWDDAVLDAGTPTAGSALVDHSLDWTEISPGRLRVTVVTGTPSALADGGLIVVPFQIAADAPVGTWPVMVESLLVASTSALAVSPTEVVDGQVVVALAQSPLEIPTLGGWSLVLLICVLLGFALHRLRRGTVALVVLGLGLALAPLAYAAVQPGDANGDGSVNAADIAVIVDQILERGVAPGDPDCNGDTLVDVRDTICIAQTAPNSAPVLEPLADLQVREREIVALVAAANDLDLPADTLSWSLVERPAGASIDLANGSLLWVPSSAQIGAHTFRVRVTDRAGASDERTFTVDVRDLGGPPTLDAIAGRQVVELATLNLNTTATDPDLPNDTLTFSLPLSPPGMTIDPASGAVSWTPGTHQVGMHDVTVQVDDADGHLDFTHFAVEVLEINVAPQARNDVFEARLGDRLQVAAPGVLTNDSDPNGDALTAVLATDVAQGDLSLAADGSFEFLLEPPDRTTPVELELLCQTGPSTPERGFSTRGTLAVGDVDGDGDLEIVGVDHMAGCTCNGEFWIVDADTCIEERDAVGNPVMDYSLVASHGGVYTSSKVALLDIDGDGDLELIGARNYDPAASIDGEHLIAVHHDGSLAWVTGTSHYLSTTNGGSGKLHSAGLELVDIDADGTVEIVVGIDMGFNHNVYSGVIVYNAEDGTIQWEYMSDFRQGGSNDQKMATVADLDLDGTMEVIVHNTVLDHDGMPGPVGGPAQTGEVEFRLPTPVSVGTVTAGHLVLAVANFDDDAFPELLGRDRRNRYLFEHDGTVKWQEAIPNVVESQIVVADFDGDEELEMSDMPCDAGENRCFLQVLDIGAAGTSLLWSHEGNASLDVANLFRDDEGAIAFDANRDGAHDLVFRHTPSTATDGQVYVIDGTDGSVLAMAEAPNRKTGEHNLTAVADVDQDGDAEIIISWSVLGTDYLRVWTGSAANPLPAAPPYRNQWNFNEAMVNPDLTIPTNPVPHWLQPGRNGYFLLEQEPDPLIGTMQTFTYRANDGVLDSGGATVTLDILPAGNPPRFLTEPDALTTRGFQYTYAPIVVDPDLGDTVTFHLTAGPDGMTVDPVTGEVRWLPDTNGIFPVSLLATDTIGFAVDQSWDLEVGDPVTTPDVVGLPKAAAEADILAANLLVGKVSETLHPTVPAGAVSAQTPIGGSVTEFGNAVDLVISLGPAPEDVDNDGDTFTENGGDCNDGDNTIFPGAPDPAGDGIDQDCDGFDGSEPVAQVVIRPDMLDLLAGETFQLQAYAIFADGTSQIATSLATWQSLNSTTATVSPGGRLIAIANTGPAQITATVDAVVGTAMVNVTDFDGSDDDAPTVEIASPQDGESVFGPIEVLGTANDPNLVRYELAISPAGEETFTGIGGGTAPIVGGKLGDLDPTLLLNGLYALRLTVLDAGGNQTIDQVTVQVDGERKIGHFTLDFTDLEVPLSGIPITVSRTYDSRDKRQGDFGVGWRLGLQTVELTCTNPLGEGWFVGRSGLAFSLVPTRLHRCAVQIPGQRAERFDFVPSVTVSPLVPFSFVSGSFQPLPGTRGRLEVPDGIFLRIADAQPGAVSLLDDSDFSLFVPEQFRYTTETDVRIEFGPSGVTLIEDRNGNSLAFDAGGLTHSSGSSVAFERDARDRIVKVTDPLGNERTYTYSAVGDLSTATDFRGNTTRFFYGARHDLLRVEDPLGNRALRNEYDADGRLIRQLDADGKEVVFTHDIAGQREEVTDRLGNTTVFEYDALGNVTAVVDALGHRWLRSYDTFGNQLSRTDPLGNVTSWTYDAQGRPLTVTDPMGRVSSTTYDDLGNPLTVTNPLGEQIVNTYDSRGNRLTSRDPEGNVTRWGYDGAGNVTEMRDASGAVDAYTYDGQGRPLSWTGPEGVTVTLDNDARGQLIGEHRTLVTDAGVVPVDWAYNYDEEGNLRQFDSPLGEIATTSFDANNQLIGAVNPVRAWSLQRDAQGRPASAVVAGRTATQVDYDAEGRALEATLPEGLIVTRAYDALGRSVTSTVLGGGTKSQTWDAAGRLQSVSNGAGNTRTYTYDANGSVIATELPGGARITTNYDAAGRITSATGPIGTTYAFDHDRNGQVTRVTFPDGATRSRTYDANGRLETFTDFFGLPWSLEYSPGGRISTIHAPDGSVAHYSHDSDGSLDRVTDPRGNTTLVLHDARGREIGRTLPGGQTEQCTYDSDGRPASCTDFNGTTTTWNYDDVNRTSTRSAPDGSEVSTFDDMGRLLTKTDVNGTTEMTYDAAGRLVSWREPAGGPVTSYGFDAAGRLASMTTPRGTTTYLYDARGFLASKTGPEGTTTWTRDDGGRPLQVDMPDSSSVLRSYDIADRVLSLDYQSPSGSSIRRITYSYDTNGQISGFQESPGRAVSYVYDAMGRLQEETTSNGGSTSVKRYAYDAGGNLISLTAPSGTHALAYDANDRLLQDGTWTYGWDDNGSLTSRSDGTSTESFIYDSQKRLTRFERSGPSPTVVDYRYAIDGLLLSREQDGVRVDFVWDRVSSQFPRLIETRDAAGALLRHYDYGDDGPLQMFEAGLGTRTLMADHLGTVQALASTGAVVDDTPAGAFGVRDGELGTDLDFLGAYRDAATGLVFLHHRWYSPEIARFTQPDGAEADLQDSRSLNRYVYTYGDPINRVDRDGRLTTIQKITVAFAIVGTIHVALAVRASAKSFGSFSAALHTGFGLTVAFQEHQRLDAFYSGFAGETGFGAGAVGLGIGVESLKFRGGAGTATYGYFSSSLNSGVSNFNLTGGTALGLVWDTPSPDDYSGYFFGVNFNGPSWLGTKINQALTSGINKTAALVGRRGIGGFYRLIAPGPKGYGRKGRSSASGSSQAETQVTAAWSPTITYCADPSTGRPERSIPPPCRGAEPHVSHGLRAYTPRFVGTIGRPESKYSFGISVSYYWWLNAP